jgi:hypothetical protein
MRAAVPTLLGDFAAQLPVGLRSTEAGFAPLAMPLLARVAGKRPTGGDPERQLLLGAALAALVDVVSNMVGGRTPLCGRQVGVLASPATLLVALPRLPACACGGPTCGTTPTCNTTHTPTATATCATQAHGHGYYHAAPNHASPRLL